jgi:hypothetical protein
MRLVFSDEFIPSVYDIKIKTDSLNLKNAGVYGKIVGILNDLDFTPSSNTPIFEIICIDAENLTFKIDKIR